jgi:hypothetical protein
LSAWAVLTTAFATASVTPALATPAAFRTLPLTEIAATAFGALLLTEVAAATLGALLLTEIAAAAFGALLLTEIAAAALTLIAILSAAVFTASPGRWWPTILALFSISALVALLLMADALFVVFGMRRRSPGHKAP